MKTWNTNKTALLMIALTALIAWLILGCSKDEIIPPSQQPITFTLDTAQKFEYDTIPVEEYYTVTSKLASATPDSIWSDTIFRTVIRPLSRWLQDGITFVENRRDTLIVYHNGTQGVWMSEEWDYWTIED